MANVDLLTANDLQGRYPDSYYADSVEVLAPFAPAEGAIRCDVCIVGGGFTGLSSALHLAQRGYDVVLLEAQRVAFGASGRNGGQVSVGQRVDQQSLEKMVGKDTARALWDIALESVALVRRLAYESPIECKFHHGVIAADHRSRYSVETRKTVDYLREHYDYDRVAYLGTDQMRHLIGSEYYYSGLLDKGSGHLHPLQFGLGLAQMAVNAGVRIFENSRVKNIVAGDPVRVTTTQGGITADHLILACNGYLGDLEPSVSECVMPINNFIVATEPLSQSQQASILRNNYAVYDSKFVVNYFRFSEDRRLLFGGSESYSYRFPKDIIAKVRKPMLKVYPQLHNVEIDYAWGGTLGITMNRLPYFKRLDGNILNLSGYSGHGVALATLAGVIAADAVAGQAERFDIMASIPSQKFPGSTALRSPLLALGMLWYSMLDKL